MFLNLTNSYKRLEPTFKLYIYFIIQNMMKKNYSSVPDFYESVLEISKKCRFRINIL